MDSNKPEVIIFTLDFEGAIPYSDAIKHYGKHRIYALVDSKSCNYLDSLGIHKDYSSDNYYIYSYYDIHKDNIINQINILTNNILYITLNPNNYSHGQGFLPWARDNLGIDTGEIRNEE